MTICDSHHHLWDHQGSDIRRYLPNEFWSDTSGGHKIVSTVFVECMAFYRADGPEALRPVGETEFAAGVASMSASGRYGPTRIAAAIVAFADLSLGGSVDEILCAHKEAAGGHLRGVRHAAAFIDDPHINNSHTNPIKNLYFDSNFRAGFKCLVSHDLSFDAWIYHPQIPQLTDLAHSFPDATIILDHVGGPLGIGPFANKREEVYPLWRRDMKELSRCPNVNVKLGGLAMKMCGFGYHKMEVPPSSDMLANDWRPYFLECIELFGPERCMFESNFPVDKSSCGYTVLWNAFKIIADGFSRSEKISLFHDNAVRLYGF